MRKQHLTGWSCRKMQSVPRLRPPLIVIIQSEIWRPRMHGDQRRLARQKAEDSPPGGGKSETSCDATFPPANIWRVWLRRRSKKKRVTSHFLPVPAIIISFCQLSPFFFLLFLGPRLRFCFHLMKSNVKSHVLLIKSHSLGWTLWTVPSDISSRKNSVLVKKQTGDFQNKSILIQRIQLMSNV